MATLCFLCGECLPMHSESLLCEECTRNAMSHPNVGARDWPAWMDSISPRMLPPRIRKVNSASHTTGVIERYGWRIGDDLPHRRWALAEAARKVGARAVIQDLDAHWEDAVNYFGRSGRLFFKRMEGDSQWLHHRAGENSRARAPRVTYAPATSDGADYCPVCGGVS